MCACDKAHTGTALPLTEAPTHAGGAAASGGSSAYADAPDATWARAIADSMIATWPELDARPEDCTGPSDCFSMSFGTVPAGPAPKFWEYTYGVPLVGLQKLYELTDEPAYLAFVQKYVDRYVSEAGDIDYGKAWPLDADGAQAAPNDPTTQDVIQPSSLLFGLYDVTHADKYLKALASTRDVFHRIHKNPAGAFWHKPSYPNQQWLDGIYMSEPLLAKYGALHAAGDDDADDCFDTAATQIKLAAEHTYDARTGLYVHAWNGAPDGVWLGLNPPSKVPPLAGSETSPVVWARSLAWFITGTVDVLEYLPESHADRAALLTVVENIAKGLQRYQDPETGLFYQVVDVMDGPLPERGGYPDEADVVAAPNWLETSASALFAYGLAKAVRLGFVPDEYSEVAHRAWKGVKSRVELAADGRVTIRGTVVGMSVGGTYNAYVNADFRSDLTQGEPPAAADCPSAAEVPAGTSVRSECKYLYVRSNVPQGFGAVLLAASELDFAH